MEREIAEAVLEEGDTPDDVIGTASGNEDVGSESDSESGEVMVGGQHPQGIQYSGSMEASLWSLDMSASSGLETSVFETEVRRIIIGFILRSTGPHSVPSCSSSPVIL